MDIFQTLIYIGLIYRTHEPCSKVHIHLMTNKVLRLRIEKRSESTIEIFNFQKEIVWPGRMSIDENGMIQIQFNKKVHENWEVPFATRVVNVTYVPNGWEAQVLSNEPLTHDSTLVSFAHINKVFNYMHPGQFLQVMHYHEGRLRNYTFTPVPMFPIRSLEYPNPRPGAFISMGSSTQVITKAYPAESLSGWLSRRRLGTTVKVSNPIGDYCAYDYKHKELVYIVSTGTSVKNLGSMILWFLQVNSNTNVTLLMFCRSENDVIWFTGLRSISNATLGRFTYHTILSHASRLWRGKRGRPHYRWLQQFIPLANETDLDKTHIFLSGRRTFCNVTKEQLITQHLYPEETIMLFNKHELLGNILRDQVASHYQMS